MGFYENFFEEGRGGEYPIIHALITNFMEKTHVRVKISELKPHPTNPKGHDDKMIKSSIESLGFVDDIIIDENNMILSGHGSLKAMTELGNEEIDCIRITGWTDEQKNEFLLLSNKTVEAGGWNNEMLAKFDQGLLSKCGFDSQELDKIFNRETEKDNDVPEVPEEQKAKLGDIYKLGNHIIICGDSTDPNVLLKLMNGEKAHMCFTDPPYNVAYEGGGSYANHGTPNREMILNDKMDKGKFFEFLSEISKRIVENVRGGGLYLHVIERNRQS